MWICPGCGESVEDSFDVCWNCSTAQDGTEVQPSSSDETDIAEPITFGPEPTLPPIPKRTERSYLVKDRSGFAYSDMADIALIVGQICAAVACLGVLISGIVLVVKGLNPAIVVLVTALAFLLHLAMFVVFARVRKL